MPGERHPGKGTLETHYPQGRFHFGQGGSGGKSASRPDGGGQTGGIPDAEMDAGQAGRPGGKPVLYFTVHVQAELILT